MAATTATYARDIRGLFAELVMRTMAVSISGAIVLLAVAVLLLTLAS